MKMKWIGRHDGFTLIEVLIALVVFSVGALGALGLLSVVLNGNKDAQVLTEATAAARSEMERIMGQTGSTLAECTGTCTAYNAGACSYNNNCWREVRSAPNGSVFQVDNHRQVGSTAVTVRVAVRYPRSRDARGIVNGGSPPAGWTDCLATPENCKTLFFYNQKVK